MFCWCSHQSSIGIISGGSLLILTDDIPRLQLMNLSLAPVMAEANPSHNPTMIVSSTNYEQITFYYILQQIVMGLCNGGFSEYI